MGGAEPDRMRELAERLFVASRDPDTQKQRPFGFIAGGLCGALGYAADKPAGQRLRAFLDRLEELL